MLRIVKPVRFHYRLGGDEFPRLGTLEPCTTLAHRAEGRDAGGAEQIKAFVGPLSEQQVLIPLADDEWEPFSRVPKL